MNRTCASTIGLAGVASLVAIAWFMSGLTDLFYQSSEFSFPKEVVSSKPSPSGKYVAKILYDRKTKNYFFAIEGANATQLVLDKKLVPSVGYHDPVLNVSWSRAGTARIVVDRDFGEGNLVFEFNVKTLSIEQKL